MSKSKQSQEVPVSAQAIIEAAAAAMESVKEKATQVPVAAEGVVLNSYQNKVLKSNQHEPGGWLHSPANLEVFKAAVEDLQEVNTLRGNATERVQWVRAALLKGTRKIHIFPTDKTDPDAIPVIYNRSAAWINLITLLGNTRLKVDTGYRERYTLRIVEKGPVGPALEMNMGRMMDRRTETKRYRTIGAPNSAPAVSEPAEE